MGEVHKGDSGCEVEVILDSVSPDNIRLTTIRLRYWRPIHAELMTHRVFSRNARSSRAVPVTTLLKEDPFIPEFGSNQKGMQSGAVLDPETMARAKHVWLDLIGHTRALVKELQELGVHKQWANRPLEWFGWIDVLVTSTDWDNWFELRDHPDATPEIHDLAIQMRIAMDLSSPELMAYGEWHLPYITAVEWQDDEGGRISYGPKLEALKVLSAARCARLSYKPFDGNPDYDAEKTRYDRLVSSTPVHASPTEHLATPDMKLEVSLGKGQRIIVWQEAEKQGNFVGWKQHRKDIPYEAIFDRHYEVI
jgi:hypothetical protein